MLLYWIWLAMRTGISDRVRLVLLERFGSPEHVYFAQSEAYREVGELRPEGLASLEDKNLKPAEQVLRDCADRQIRILTFRDAAYPRKVQNIPDAPLVLYYKGTLPDFDNAPVIGVVGTRKASAYGLGVAKRMGYQIAKCGAVVVSGIAGGIDGMSMRGALTAGGCTVGVLGCGADVVYPASNRSLYADTEKYGCLLTEFVPGTPPIGWNFPRRNRIISGLSDGVLVVEAPHKSGALITARCAADQGRDVFVVPGNIDVDSCEGNIELLREGGIAVRSGWDVVSEYAALYPDKIIHSEVPSRMAGYPDEVRREEQEARAPAIGVAQKVSSPKKAEPAESEKDKIVIDNGGKAPYSDQEKQYQSLSPAEKSVVEHLTDAPQLVDDVIAAAGIPASAVLSCLTMLEIKGVITRLPGKRVALKKQK